jgi:hypothetical protein
MRRSPQGGGRVRVKGRWGIRRIMKKAILLLAVVLIGAGG